VVFGILFFELFSFQAKMNTLTTQLVKRIKSNTILSEKIPHTICNRKIQSRGSAANIISFFLCNIIDKSAKRQTDYTLEKR
jgi:hypothetical protein